MWWPLWILAAVIFVFLELHTQAFASIFLGFGAAVAAVVSALGQPFWIEGFTFVGASILSMGLVRPPLKHWFEKRQVTHVFRGTHGGFVGQEALTLDEVGDQHHPGHAELARQRWLACSEDGVSIAADVRVKVVAMRGTTLVVQPSAPAPTAAPPEDAAS